MNNSNNDSIYEYSLSDLQLRHVKYSTVGTLFLSAFSGNILRLHLGKCASTWVLVMNAVILILNMAFHRKGLKSYSLLWNMIFIHKNTKYMFESYILQKNRNYIYGTLKISSILPGRAKCLENQIVFYSLLWICFK